jgi:hypothetical protein
LFKVKLDAASESFLTVGTNGVKLSGVQSAIDAAKEDVITGRIVPIETNVTTLSTGLSSEVARAKKA